MNYLPQCLFCLCNDRELDFHLQKKGKPPKNQRSDLPFSHRLPESTTSCRPITIAAIQRTRSILLKFLPPASLSKKRNKQKYTPFQLSGKGRSQFADFTHGRSADYTRRSIVDEPRQLGASRMDASDRLKDKLAGTVGLSVTVEHLITSVKRSRLNSGYELANPLSELSDPPTPVLCPSPSLFPLCSPSPALSVLCSSSSSTSFLRLQSQPVHIPRESFRRCLPPHCLSLSLSLSLVFCIQCLSVCLQHALQSPTVQGYLRAMIRASRHAYGTFGRIGEATILVNYD